MTDIQMPGTDGFQVSTNILATEMTWFEAMRRQQSTVKFKARKCPVVAVTAFCDRAV